MGIHRLDEFLPTTMKEVKRRGWETLDVVLFTGDAYVDHPSFGIAVMGRILEAQGYKVAIVSQPNWQDDLRDFKKMGKPNLFFGVSAGNMDSMVNHYTAAKRLRSNDAYTAGGESGHRPDYASVVYSNILKSIYPDVPIVLGGIESSLRRLAHYDYWKDMLLPSIMIDSKADVLVYGMGEKPIIEVAQALHNGFNMNTLRRLKQVCFVAPQSYIDTLNKEETIFMKSFAECLESKKAYNHNFKVMEVESNKQFPKRLVEPYDDCYVVVSPPHPPMSEEEIDSSFDLPYTREPHPKYEKRGNIPAYEMIKYSINMHRGCFGGCSFCTISAHQGKYVVSRSKKSILKEIKNICKDPNFKGNLSDIGGPSANMYKMGGKDKSLCATCARPSCLFPTVCKNLNNDHSHIIKLYKEIREMKEIKHAYIGSGIRYDLIDEKNRQEYLHDVVTYHTSGRLKVAPEHTSDRVLKMMRKPPFSLFNRLNDDFQKICAKENLRYQLIPYFISSHPACQESDMKELSKKMEGLHFHLEQVQDFTPTPMTLSTAIFYTGVDPYTNEKVFVECDPIRKKRQKEFFFYSRPPKKEGNFEKNSFKQKGDFKNNNFRKNRDSKKSFSKSSKPYYGKKK